MALPYNRQLDANDVLTNFANMIISIEMRSYFIDQTSALGKSRTAGSMFGNTALYRYHDITATRAWQGDAEAATLLELYRNPRMAEQDIRIKKSRITYITVSQYIDKQAFLDGNGWSKFAGTLVGVVGDNKKVFENGLYKTFVGNNVSTLATCNIEVDLTDIPAATDPMNIEATKRLASQRIARAIKKVGRDMGDNTRDFNLLKYLRSMSLNGATFIFNGDLADEYAYIDKFIRDEKVDFNGEYWTPNYFGDNGAAFVSPTIANSYARIELNSDGTDNMKLTPAQITAGVYRIYPGGKIPTGVTINLTDPANAGLPLSQVGYIGKSDVLCKIYFPEALPFMTGFEAATMFVNGKSLTDTHFLIWNYNDFEYLADKPFITVTLKTA